MKYYIVVTIASLILFFIILTILKIMHMSTKVGDNIYIDILGIAVITNLGVLACIAIFKSLKD